jgi:hypothetical protein
MKKKEFLFVTIKKKNNLYKYLYEGIKFIPFDIYKCFFFFFFLF